MGISAKQIVMTISLCLVCTAVVFAQLDVNGTISGTAYDPSGAVLPGAEITITNLENRSVRRATTDADGSYFIPSLAPGTYSMSVKGTGFKNYAIEQVRIDLKQLVTLDIHMELGTVEETLQVTATAPLLNSTDATIGTVITAKEIVEIPLDGRHFTQLLLLAPGASPDQTGQQTSDTIALGEGGISPSINGMRAQMNNFRLDGMDNNMRFTNSFATSPPPDAIEEIKTSGHDSDAQTTLAAGANINVVTRAGTMTPHASLWEFIRNDKFSANNYITNTLGSSKLPYRQNQYGFFFGAPVYIPKIWNGRKTKTFFGAYWEGFKSRQSAYTSATVPTQAMKNGDFSSSKVIIYDPLTVIPCASCTAKYTASAFPNNAIPQNRINPLATAYLNQIYPLPNQTGGSNNFVLPQSRKQDSNNYGIRVDQTLSDNNHIYGRYSQYHIEQVTPGALVTDATLRLNTGLNGMAAYSHIFNPTFILDVQVGYNRAAVPGRAVPLGSSFNAAVGDTLSTAMPFGYLPATLSFSGGSVNGASFSNSDLANPDYSYQYNFDFKKVYGNHDLGFGFRLLHWRHEIGAAGQATLTFTPQTTGLPGTSTTGDPFASFLLGYPSTTNKSTTPAGNIFGNVYVGYIQDNWKVTPKLTLNLGLQYSFAAPPLDEKPVAAFDYELALTNPTATNWAFAYLWTGTNPITGAPPNVRASILEPDYNDFAPRVGVAYRAADKFIVRSGFGIFYDFNTNLVQNAGIRVADRSWPYFPTDTISGQNQTGLGPNNPVISLNNPYVASTLTTVAPGAAAATSSGAFEFDRHARDPYVLQYNFELERSLPGDIVISTAYLGAGGRKLPTGVQGNTTTPSAAPVNPRRPLPNIPNSFTEWVHEANSSYNALQTKVEKRFSQGLIFRESFTWSKSLDVTSDANTSGIEYPSDWSLSRGPSDFDRTILNAFSYVYELPFGRGRKYASGVHGFTSGIVSGWRLSGTIFLRSGQRFSIFTGRDNGNIGTNSTGNEKANIIGEFLPDGFVQNSKQWFNTAAFAIPASGNLGDSSRNEFKADPYRRFDFALSKDYRLRESLGLQFRAEAFNAFNQTTLGIPSNTVSSTTFGQVTTALRSRDLQFGLKLHF